MSFLFIFIFFFQILLFALWIWTSWFSCVVDLMIFFGLLSDTKHHWNRLKTGKFKICFNKQTLVQPCIRAFINDVVKMNEKLSSESFTHDNHVELVVMKSGADLILLLIVLTYPWPLWICLFLQMKKNSKWFFGTEPWKSTFLHISFKKYKQLRIYRLLSLVSIFISSSVLHIIFQRSRLFCNQGQGH